MNYIKEAHQPSLTAVNVIIFTERETVVAELQTLSTETAVEPEIPQIHLTGSLIAQ